MTINTFSKFAPNVFVVKTTETYTKGDIALITTKYGKEVEVEIFNHVKQDGEYSYYSYVRCDDEDSISYAKRRAERFKQYSLNAMKRSDEYFSKAEEGREFLRLGEPIKVGHHSEKWHRGLLERNQNRMKKSFDEMSKAEEYNRKAEYWERKVAANKIDLSMPQSLEFFENELSKLKEVHQKLRDNPELREHAYSLTYAKKAVNEMSKKVELAKKLWA